MAVEIARVYGAREQRRDEQRVRVLVDRLWPRGVRREDLEPFTWERDVAPSAALRRSYGHDPGRFEDFARRYRAELTREPAASSLDRLQRVARDKRLVLLTATRDLEHSAAQVLAEVLGEGTRR